jgi:hypothetical protein
MYLMFKPDLPAAIFVPLRAVDWSFAATVVWDGEKWTLTRKSPGGPEEPADAGTAIHPEWSFRWSALTDDTEWIAV